MTQLAADQEITLQAFQAAVDTYQQRGLDLPESIAAIADHLESHIDQLDFLSESDPTFEIAYQTVRSSLQKTSSQRAKLLNPPETATHQNTIHLPSTSNGNNPPPVETNGQHKTGPPPTPSTEPNAVNTQPDDDQPDDDQPEWIRRGNTIVTMVSGGAFLGVLLAQFPGAIVGAIVAGIFGWYTSKSKTA
jgi:hypothetical protein